MSRPAHQEMLEALQTYSANKRSHTQVENNTWVLKLPAQRYLTVMGYVIFAVLGGLGLTFIVATLRTRPLVWWPVLIGLAFVALGAAPIIANRRRTKTLIVSLDDGAIYRDVVSDVPSANVADVQRIKLVAQRSNGVVVVYHPRWIANVDGNKQTFRPPPVGADLVDQYQHAVGALFAFFGSPAVEVSPPSSHAK